LHVSEGTPEERQGLESYLRHLDGPEVTRYQKLVPLGSQTESAMALFDGANDSLNINLANSNAIRVANLCQRSEGYGRYRYALAGALLNCREYPKFFPPGLYTELMANLNTRFDLENVWTDTMIQKFVQVIQTNPRHFQLSSKATFETLLYSAGGDQAFLRLLLDTYRDQGISRADPMGARLRLVMEGRGLKIDNWFLDLTQPTYRFLPADGQEVIYHLLKLDRGFDSDLKAKLAKLNPESRTSICQDMRDLSLLALKSTHAKPVAPEPKIDLAAYPVTFVKTCAKCHDSGEDYPPTIPFRSSLQMTEWLKRGSNLLLLRKKILTNDETERMPPTRILTADELNNIENWLAVF
ncbi:MAG: hypothetical protein ACXVA9_11110, partial [Bdellovibrionales bacterium]